jgi:hypothetical protein
MRKNKNTDGESTGNPAQTDRTESADEFESASPVPTAVPADENTSQEPAGSGASEGTAKHEDDEEPMVRYVGEFPRREISVSDWEKAGITDMPAVTWDRSRDMKIPASVFNERALQVLRQEGHFEVP